MLLQKEIGREPLIFKQAQQIGEYLLRAVFDFIQNRGNISEGLSGLLASHDAAVEASWVEWGGSSWLGGLQFRFVHSARRDRSMSWAVPA